MDRCKVSYCIILPFMESQITKLAKFYRKHHHCLIYGSMAIWAVNFLRGIQNETDFLPKILFNCWCIKIKINFRAVKDIVCKMILQKVVNVSTQIWYKPG